MALTNFLHRGGTFLRRAYAFRSTLGGMEMLILGFLIGLAVAPALRSWVIWREHRAASREAWLAEETLRRLEDEDHATHRDRSDA